MHARIHGPQPHIYANQTQKSTNTAKGKEGAEEGAEVLITVVEPAHRRQWHRFVVDVRVIIFFRVMTFSWIE